MSTSTIDYDALAQQHGGSAQVDYDALAAQHGGSAAASAPPATQQPGVLDPRGGWSPGDFLRGAAAGVKNLIAHPIDTIEGMGEAVTAGGMAPGGMYPTTAATGRPEDSQANAAVQQQAQQSQAGAARFMGQNPAYTIGGVVGPAVVTAGAAKVAPMIAEGAADLAGRAAPKLYESALKPSTTLSQAERGAIVQTGLQNSIPISADGLDKLNARIDGLNQAIKDQIAADPTRPISPGAAVQRLQASRARFANQVNPTSDLASFDNAQQEFLDQFRSQPGGAVRNLTAQEAQEMKQGTYRALGNKSYGELKGATVEAQKALARGLKDEIASQFPEISQLNATESRLLDLQPVLEKAVNRISNHQLFGIGTPLVGGATAAVTGSGPLGAAAAFLKAAIDNPVVKSRLAIALSKGAKIPYGEAASRVGAYSAALGSSVGVARASQDDQAPTQ